MSGSERGRNEGESLVWQPVFRRLTSKNDQGFIRRVVTIDLLYGRGVLRVCHVTGCPSRYYAAGKAGSHKTTSCRLARARVVTLERRATTKNNENQSVCD
jgi:hypothetical protein